MIAIEKLFDDGEDVLCSNPNITFLHDSISYVLFTMTYTLQIACQSFDAVIDFEERNEKKGAIVVRFRNYDYFCAT